MIILCSLYLELRLNKINVMIIQFLSEILRQITILLLYYCDCFFNINLLGGAKKGFEGLILGPPWCKYKV